MSIKQHLKQAILRRVHARPEIESRIATRVIDDGVPRFLSWDFEEEIQRTRTLMDSLKVSDFEYKFAWSVEQPCLYGSTYAFLLLGLLGRLPESDQVNNWVDFIDGFQSKSDGLFRDQRLAGPSFEAIGEWGEGWGAKHLAAHICIVYIRANRVPPFELKVLEPFYDATKLEAWLDGFSFDSRVWPQSNYVMNIAILLQFARDYMGEDRAAKPIKRIVEWLLENQNPQTGMWHDFEVNDYPELGDAIRAAYHYYPLLEYENVEVPHGAEIVKTVLRSQNRWGGFNPEALASGPCEDIDAIDPLVRYARFHHAAESDIQLAVKKAMIWVLSCQHEKGGYEAIPEHGCHYGGHPLTTSQPGEPNLFATWFRTLTLAHLANYLGIPNAFELGGGPGYELQIPISHATES